MGPNKLPPGAAPKLVPRPPVVPNALVPADWPKRPPVVVEPNEGVGLPNENIEPPVDVGTPGAAPVAPNPVDAPKRPPAAGTAVGCPSVFVGPKSEGPVDGLPNAGAVEVAVFPNRPVVAPNAGAAVDVAVPNVPPKLNAGFC